MLNFVNPWTNEIETARIREDKYCMGKRLYLGLDTIDPDCGFFEPYCDITVNLPDEMLSGEDCAFVDVNNCNWLPRFLEENGLAEPTGMMGFSGWGAYTEYRFYAYPEYRFNMERVRSHAEGAA